MKSTPLFLCCIVVFVNFSFRLFPRRSPRLLAKSSSTSQISTSMLDLGLKGASQIMKSQSMVRFLYLFQVIRRLSICAACYAAQVFKNLNFLPVRRLGYLPMKRSFSIFNFYLMIFRMKMFVLFFQCKRRRKKQKTIKPPNR